MHLTSSGVDRWYLRDVPPSYGASVPMALVFDVHGYEEGAAIEAAMTKLGSYGDQHGFITVTPNGLGPEPHWDTTLGSKDLKFIGDAVDDVERTLCIDTNRVYATGLSQGRASCRRRSRVSTPIASPQSRPSPASPGGSSRVARPARPVAGDLVPPGTADGSCRTPAGSDRAALELPTPDGKGKLGNVKGIQNASHSPSIPQQPGIGRSATAAR